MSQFKRLRETIVDGYSIRPGVPLVTFNTPSSTRSRWRRNGLICKSHRGNYYELTRRGAEALGWKSRLPGPIARILDRLNRPLEI